MKRSSNEAVILSRRINEFLYEYVPSQKTHSEHTLKSYSLAMTLYLGFLETEKGIDSSNLCGNLFSAENIEEWLLWLMNKRGCSPETANVRLGSLRAFLIFLGKREVSMLHLATAASQIRTC